MIETHPFDVFVPPKTQYLLLGSFTGKLKDTSYDWFYTNGRNQFWPILTEVYGLKLDTKIEKQRLFTCLRLAIGDIILSCERKANSNLDINLTSIVFNTKAVTQVIQKNNLKTIYFSSRFVEKLFRKEFKALISNYPSIELITLPSPSPRYAAMSKVEKIAKYKELLPRLGR